MVSPDRHRREMEAEHQPRTLRAGSELEPRISRADERRFADQERDRRDAERREHERQRLNDEAARTAELGSRVQHLIGEVDKLRAIAATRREWRDVDHHARRLRAALAALLRAS